MDIRHITNANLWEIDWAETDRKALLRATQQQTNGLWKSKGRAPVWMVDASARDRRSVKAQLAGRLSCRVMWWHLFSRLHQRFSDAGALEAAMVDFHRLHQALTSVRMDFSAGTRALAAAVFKRRIGRVPRTQLPTIADA